MNATQHPFEKPYARLVESDRRALDTLPLRQGWGPWGSISQDAGYWFRCELQQGAYRDIAVEGDPRQGQWWITVPAADRAYLTDTDNAIRDAVQPLRNALFGEPEEAMAAVDAAIAHIPAVVR